MNQISPTDLASSLSAGLGALVMWELSSTLITPDELRSLLVSLGEDPSIVPDIDPASAASRASREWGMGRGNENRFKAEVVFRGPGQIGVGILQRQRVSADVVRWEQVDAVDIWTDAAGMYTGNTVRGGSEQGHSYAALFYKRLTHLDADWIRPNLIQARLDAVSAFAVRRQGGVVFVDRTHLEEVERLARIVRSIGSSSFDIVHVQATGESQRSISRAASAYLEDQINELTTKLDGWAERAKAPRIDAVEGLLEQVGDLVCRGGLYSDVLQVTLEGVNDRLATVKARALALLVDGVEDAAAS